jgi:hypothetical protein
MQGKRIERVRLELTALVALTAVGNAAVLKMVRVGLVVATIVVVPAAEALVTLLC